MNKLYRRNNNGMPTVWWASFNSDTNSIAVFYGLVRGNIRKEVYTVTQKMVIKNLKVDIMRRLNKVINILMKYVICKIDPP